MISETIKGTINDIEIGGTIRGVLLEDRKDIFVRVSKVAAVVPLKPNGPTRLLFDGGGYVDVCGSATVWSLRIRLREIADGGRST
jgi:hypothetical protein